MILWRCLIETESGRETVEVRARSERDAVGQVAVARPGCLVLRIERRPCAA